MSVKRYTQNIKCVEPSYLAQMIQSGMVECSIGEYVLHSDYARLKAEVERLKTENTYLKGEKHPYNDLGSMMPKYLLEHWVKENASLKAENERLRKAGDWMREALEEGPIDYQCRIDRWNAAKEGKQP